MIKQIKLHQKNASAVWSSRNGCHWERTKRV